jgi:hypothetical protein
MYGDNHICPIKDFYYIILQLLLGSTIGGVCQFSISGVSFGISGSFGRDLIFFNTSYSNNENALWILIPSFEDTSINGIAPSSAIV